MGVFSWTCAKTHLPIMNSMVAELPLSEVVVLGRDGSILKGRYDGYGRVLGDVGETEIMDAVDSDHVRMVLAAFYCPEEDRYDTVAPNHHDPGQGHFHDDGFLRRAFEDGGFDSYDAYRTALEEGP